MMCFDNSSRAETNIRFGIQIVWIENQANNSNSLTMLFCLKIALEYLNILIPYFYFKYI